MYCYSGDSSSWANVNDLYDRFGDEFVDKLATRNKYDTEVKRYIADESTEGRFKVIALALCDAKALIIRKLKCKYSNVSLLNSSAFPSIKLWHIKMTIETLKVGGDCSGCNCEELDKFIECGDICNEDETVCLSSKLTFITASEAVFTCECHGGCSCC